LRISSVCQSASRNRLILAQILAHGRDGLQVHVTLGVWSPYAPRLRVIAVLPFLDLSDNQQMACFAKDLREEILLKLAKVDGFKVVRSTNAAYLLEGNVRRVDNRIRVHVQLINVGREQSIWAETYDRNLPMDSL
jgi:TolB-like protein